MALCRMNTFQFHFMEDPGCTVQVDCLPNMVGFPRGGGNCKYTKAEVREMIAYAAELGITVTPFVEVLSHVRELALEAGIACPGDKIGNMYDVCLGQEKTFEVIEMVLKEVAELFLYGINRVNRIVNKLGKVMMWNADIQPAHLPEELDRNIIIHYYRENNGLGRERIYNLNMNGYMEEGFSLINSFYPETYMDYGNYMKIENLVGWTPYNRPWSKRAMRPGCPAVVAVLGKTMSIITAPSLPPLCCLPIGSGMQRAIPLFTTMLTVG